MLDIGSTFNTVSYFNVSSDPMVPRVLLKMSKPLSAKTFNSNVSGHPLVLDNNYTVHIQQWFTLSVKTIA
jgi:uncharacterized lipoprotein NlpE involved in copper resistance